MLQPATKTHSTAACPNLLNTDDATDDVYTVCAVFSSLSFWTSSSLDVPAGVTQEEGHTGFFIHLLSAVRALIFLARRTQPLFLSLVDREVEHSTGSILNIMYSDTFRINYRT